VLSPYHVRDPELKRFKKLLEQLDEMAKGFSQESRAEIHQAMEKLCHAFGVETVQCEACGDDVCFLRTHLMNGYAICELCWNHKPPKDDPAEITGYMELHIRQMNQLPG
jgi:formylmethanofuran dehydrogenase subunit E